MWVQQSITRLVLIPTSPSAPDQRLPPNGTTTSLQYHCQEGNGEDLRNHWEVRPFLSGNVSLLNREDQERRISLSRTERTNNTTDAHTICNTIQAKLDRSKKSRFPKQDPDQERNLREVPTTSIYDVSNESLQRDIGRRSAEGTEDGQG